MKKIIKIICLIALVSVMWSCEELENSQPYSGADYIRFDASSMTVTELSGTVKIPVLTSRKGAFTASFTIASGDQSAVEGTHYTVVTVGDLSFPEGVYSDTLEITVIDNLDADGTKSLEITLTPSDDSISLGFAGDVQGLGSLDFAIGDDDCPLDLAEFVGTYDVIEDGGADNYTAGVTLGNGPNTLVVDNFWGSGFVAEITFDNSDLANPKTFMFAQDTGPNFGYSEIWMTSRPDDVSGCPTSAAAAGHPDGTNSTCDKTFNLTTVIYVPCLGNFTSAVSFDFTKQ